MRESSLPDANALGEVRNPDGASAVRQAVADRAEGAMLGLIAPGESRPGRRRPPPSRQRDRFAACCVGPVCGDAERIVPITGEVAECRAEIAAGARRRGRTIPPVPIAAAVQDLTLWTRNLRDFGKTGARVFNPWEY